MRRRAAQHPANPTPGCRAVAPRGGRVRHAAARVVLRGERARLERRCAHNQVLGPCGRCPRPVDADRARDGAGAQHSDRIPGRPLEDPGTPRRRNVALEGEPLVATGCPMRASRRVPVVARGPANEVSTVGAKYCGDRRTGCHVTWCWDGRGSCVAPLVTGCSVKDSKGSHVSSLIARTVPSSRSTVSVIIGRPKLRGDVLFVLPYRATSLGGGI